MTVPARIEDAKSLEDLKEHIRLIATTEFVPAHYRNRPHAILAAIYTGREIGLMPMESLNDVYIVTDREGKPKGKPSLHASAMVKLVRRAGHSLTGEVDAEKATVIGKRADNGDTMTATYTLEQAKQAGLIRDASGWSKNPEDMLWARAVSRLCRRLFADCLGGIMHTPEDFADSQEGRLQSALSEAPGTGDVQVIEAEGGVVDFSAVGDGDHAVIDADAEAIPFGED